MKHWPLRYRFPEPNPDDEIGERWLTTKLTQPRVHLSSVMRTVRCDLYHGLSERGRRGRLAESTADVLGPWNVDRFGQGCRVDCIDIGPNVLMVLASPGRDVYGI